jgi:glycerol uptake facilitator-like aquaporin
MFTREKIGIILAELCGTFVLAVVAIAAASYFNFTAPWYVSIAVGTALATLVAVIGNVSGAHVNPAITLGLWTLRKISTSYAVVYIAAQMLGGILALAFVEYVKDVEILQQGFSRGCSIRTRCCIGRHAQVRRPTSIIYHRCFTDGRNPHRFYIWPRIY